MNLKYEITLEDYLEYYRSLSKYNFSRFWVRWIFRPFIIKISSICRIGGIWYAIAYYSEEFKYSIAIGCFCLGAGIGLLFVFSPEFTTRLSYIGLKINYQKKPSLIAERNITVNKNGLSFEAETLQIFVDWDLFNYVSETDNLLILNFHGKELQLIPKRCFDNSEEIEQFRELLHDRAKNLDDNSEFREEIAEKDGILNLEYQLEAKDYLEAKQAINFSSKWTVWYYPILIIFISGLGFYNLWKGIYRPDLLLNDRTSNDVIANGFLCFGFVFYLLLDQYPKINIFERRKIANKWNINKQMQANRKLRVTENEIILISDYFVESIAWQEYLKYIEKKNIFLLYYSQKDCQIISKKAFKTEEQIKQFRELIESHNKIMKVCF